MIDAVVVVPVIVTVDRGRRCRALRARRFVLQGCLNACAARMFPGSRQEESVSATGTSTRTIGYS
ncbi:hypothetical protein ABZ876_22340 [Streptomyces sp. NPDC046931]|uniref:hypothetical protein n=1 Tax=Streptomyces sp. NPDC046931 TaxID=3154806 RepID=UPI0033CBC868